jgi:methanogen homoaconitase large subunit
VRNGVVVEYYMTTAGKILAEASAKDRVEFGEEVEVEPDLVLVGERSSEYAGGSPSKKTVEKYRRVASSPMPASGNGKTANSVFMLLEEGVILPNSLVLHAGCDAGGLAAVSSLTLKIDDEHLRGLLRMGKCRVVAPRVVRITLEGRLKRGVAAFDIFSFARANLDPDILKGMIVEYSGNVVEKLNIYERISLCHVTQSYGAACGYTVFDDTTRRFLSKRTQSNYKVNFSDSKAYYHKDFVLTLSGLEPQIVPWSDQNSSSRVSPDIEIGSIAMVYAGGPCGGSFEAMKQISDIFKASKSLNVPFYLSPVSERAYLRALKKKILVPIVEAGGVVLPPGFDLPDIPGFDSRTEATILTTPNTIAPDYPKNLYFVNHLTAAASALAGQLRTQGR